MKLMATKNAQSGIGKDAETRLKFLLWLVKHNEDPTMVVEGHEFYHTPSE